MQEKSDCDSTTILTRTVEKMIAHADDIQKCLENLLKRGQGQLKKEIIRDIEKMLRSCLVVQQALNKFKEQLILPSDEQIKQPEHLGLIRHDLRNPISAIIGYAELILEDFQNTQDPSLLESLHKIQSSAREISSLIDELI